MKMKVLSISHSAVVKEYRKRYTQLAKSENLEIVLLCPRRWFQYNQLIVADKRASGTYIKVILSQPLTWGFKKLAHQNVTHIYPVLPLILSREKPDIIELWEEPYSLISIWTIFWVRLLCENAKIIFFSAQNILKKRLWPFEFAEKLVFKFADFAFPVNKEVALILRQKGYKKPYMVLPLGVDQKKFSPRKSSDKGEFDENLGEYGQKLDGKREIIIGFVGKLDYQKGVDLLVRASSMLEFPHRIMIIGDGPEKKSLIELAKRLGISQNICFLGIIDHDNMADHYRAMDIFVLPSRTVKGLKEQFGRAIVEAMACGVITIGSDSGEISQVIGDSKLIFQEGKSHDLAAKIGEIVNWEKDKIQRVKLSIRQRAIKEYSWRAIAKMQGKAYKKL